MIDKLHLSYLWDICKNNRYLLISIILFAIMIMHSLYGLWSGDFWEYSAVVRELSTHPLHPLHPLFIVNNSHPFFSPYLLLVALLARVGSLTSVDGLVIAGVFNLIFFLVSLRMFINCIFKKHHDAISFYSLIFILFMWSAQAWSWSGFFHFKILAFDLPYPSTFSIASIFFIFALYYQNLQSMSKVKYILSIIFTAMVFLTHPTTGIVAFIGIISISLHHYKSIGFKAVASGLFLLLTAVFLVFLWPYYSFFELIKHNNHEFNAVSYTFYKNILLIWPTLILTPFALPIFISRFKNNRFDVLILMLFSTVSVYLVGFIFKEFGIGRIISFIAIFIQIALAAQLAHLEIAKTIGKSWSAFPTILYVIVIISFNPANKTVLSRAHLGVQGKRYDYSGYNILKNNVKQYDVILSDLSTSWIIPTFGGKVIASQHPAHWIDDHNVRRQDLERFFSKEIKYSDKIAIIHHYQADYIFINRNMVENYQSYYDFGNIVSEDKNFILIKIELND
ncbi:hypothetical protein ACFL4B_00555 [Candidatus Neomarinimicrobiota bacterium]